MFTIHAILSEDLQAQVVEYLNDNLDSQLSQDVSGYARGRRRLWMPYEAPLAPSRPWQLGVQDERVWNWIIRTCKNWIPNQWTPEVALLSHGSSGAIARHRDAPYSRFQGVGINLGCATFHYEPLYQQFHWVEGTPESGPAETHELVGGEIYSFNVKNPHWVTDVDDDRWVINGWRIAASESARFRAFKSAMTRKG